MNFTLHQLVLLCSKAVLLTGLFLLAPWQNAAYGQLPEQYQTKVFLTDNIDRPLRFAPVGTDFVITNGAEFFNRPVYGGNSAFRVDGGDKPEFSLYLPGHGGNLRFGLQTNRGLKWLNDAAQVITSYRPGSLVHQIRDPLLGSGMLRLTTLAIREGKGVMVCVELSGTQSATELVWAFGGVNGMKGRRGGDIGCELEPVGSLFQLRATQCTSNVVTIAPASFKVRGKPGTIVGVMSAETQLTVADASDWNNLAGLLAPKHCEIKQPLAVGRASLRPGEPFYLALRSQSDGLESGNKPAEHRDIAAQLESKPPTETTGQRPTPADLPQIFAEEEDQRRALAGRVAVETPDPFVNASVAALNVAADAIWDEQQQTYMHGAVAWRVRLLGWRGIYTGDELGWHDRTAKHFESFAKQQNTDPVPAAIPPPEEVSNLSRNEAALHSNGDLTRSHYDMNLVGVDAFFRHLRWTGDLEFARRMWPTIERHLAWERRLFRREFGTDKLPLYEAYCCIWASDDLAYNGGGVTHSSACNLYHNRMAAQVAKLLGKDPSVYEHEADLIAQGMKEYLWLADRGWYAEWKDSLGLQLVHPNAASWTFYSTLDSEVPSPLEAWQMTRFVDTQIARFPLHGPGVPDGSYTMPTTSWMPYTWSLNNVVFAETMNTALGYWQANRVDGAFPLFKGALLDSMFLGLCPGNVGMCTYFDANRHEAQRDFGDGIGAMSRALVEGLFGVQPDLLAGEIKVRPGFPADWDDASIKHPDFQFSFHRDGLREVYLFESRFAKPLKLALEIPALRDEVVTITVNGKTAAWRVMEDSVGVPHIEIPAPPSKRQEIVVEWRGSSLAKAGASGVVSANDELEADCGAKILDWSDPQGALRTANCAGDILRGIVIGAAGHRTVFAKVQQGGLRWWQPVMFEIRDDKAVATPMDWTTPIDGTFDTINLNSVFNDRVTQIFHNEYRSPRSPFCSLATPKQGIGSWCHPTYEFDVDDSGLRAVAAGHNGKLILPNGVPLATPGTAAANNIAFVSQWNNYPRDISVRLSGKAVRLFALMAGSTSAMQSRFDNGELIVAYTDGSTTRLALRNPTTWWPIDQDYYVDDFAFARPEALPVRVGLKTGKVRVLEMKSFKGKGTSLPGGAATVLDLSLDSAKELKQLTVRALANEVVIGLMSVTLHSRTRASGLAIDSYRHYGRIDCHGTIERHDARLRAPAVTNTKAPPAATAVPPTNTPQPGPDFVTTAKAVKAQVESIGGQIDLALQVGYIDCVQLVNSYFYVTSRRELVVPPNLAGPYATYQSGIDKFTDRVHDINDNCLAFLNDPSQAGGIPQQQWSTARLGVNESSEILRQAIVDAGGTP